MTPIDGDFGRYRLSRPLGRGGMGEVYLARDRKLDRDVAIKLLAAGRTDDHEARRRFLHEAQAAAKLDHPCICPVFEVGESADGRAFIAMPYIEGETLTSRLERGRLPAREALELARHIAEALTVAHARGIVHRDLKPQNVMLTPAGLPKLLDFGIAKLRPAGLAAAEVSTASGDTAPGSVVGTPAYMAPEQVGGRDVDGRCDLFALGALLFECLTGRRAFQGRNMLEIAGAITHLSPPPVSSLCRDVPAGVDDLCQRLLQKDPMDRFQNAGEVVGALRLLTTGTGPMPRPDLRSGWLRRGARLRLAAAALLVTAGLSAGFWLWQRSRQLPEPPPESARWYRRGTEFIREGAYHSANEALEQAIRLFGDYPLAYARQAEALAELDDPGRAGERLLRMQAVLGDEARLAPEDRLRLRGIRAVVLRDLPEAVDAYRQLVERTPADAGAWVDLGRAQEAAERRTDARASYERALALDGELAPAHLRLASIEAQASRRDEALTAFANAERLHKAASNTEGETEVLLRRGSFLNAVGDLRAARDDLERALALATGSGARAQSVRARLALASVTASVGRYEEAERLVSSAIDEARRHELWTLVADGLIDQAGVLINQPHRLDEADRLVQEAARLAEGRGAQRTAARAALQRAALALQRREPALARDLASGSLEFLRAKDYRRLELTALSIVSRAERNLDELVAARATASRVLDAARDLGDDAQVAVALSSLASVASASGDLPAALAARDEAARLNERMGQDEQAPFDLMGRAELLVRLGRGSEAEPLLRALEAGIVDGNEAFRGRAHRAHYLRALAAIVDDDPAAALRHARHVVEGPPSSSTREATAILHYAQARLGRSRPSAASGEPRLSPSDERDLVYWQALESSERGDHEATWAHVTRGLALADGIGNDELAWRLAAIACGSTPARGDTPGLAPMRQRVEVARQRLRERWQAALDRYDARPDLKRLQAAMAGTSTR